MDFVRKQKIIFFLFVAIILVWNKKTTVNAQNTNITYYGDAYWAGHGDNFSKNKTIDSDDYNYGWEIGKFSIVGYSARVNDEDGNYVFLKNVGDEVRLQFVLEQDIFCLNGKSKLYIQSINSKDEYFQTPKIDMGRGTLIIQHTDYQGIKSDPIIYTNYLEALEVGNKIDISIDGPDTEVYFLEEGDYEVALDYRVAEEKNGVLIFNPKDPWQEFRISFKFSIRNGNCMSFIRDAEEGSELSNESVAPNGFVVEMNESRYLQINVKREVLSNGRDGLVEDTRYNRPVKDGDVFTEDGIYTLTTKNIYTGESTVKKIYVGADEVLIAYVNSNYTIEEINDLLAQGCTINSDGSIEWPAIEESDVAEVDIAEEEECVETIDNRTVDQELVDNEEKESLVSYLEKKVAIIVLCTAFVFLVIVLVLVAKRRKKKKQLVSEKETEPQEQE